MTGSTDYLGKATTSTYHVGLTNAAIAVQTLDPEQQQGGGHAGSFTTTHLDYLGRPIQQTQHLSNVSGGPYDLTTNTAYSATGQPLEISQAYPHGSYARWMQYDSLGRLVFNAEPNTSQNFSATPGTPGVQGWTYAYNDAGALVGTSDARGCGENIYRDRFQRPIAEDYSPCGDASQPAYTAPNLSTGQGTESFYVYDAYGQLAKLYDRASFSVFSYDARGRPTLVQRQIAPPAQSGSSSSSSASSGTSVAITGTVVDANGNPMTGVPVTLAGSGNGSTTTNQNGAYSFGGLTEGRPYSVNVGTVAGCTFSPSTVSNFNPLNASESVNFAGQGPSCGGIASSSPIVPQGNLSISGTVTAPDGTAVAGVRFTLSGSLSGSAPASTTSDASGYFAFNGLALHGSYQLQAQSPGGSCAVSPSNSNFNQISANVVQLITATAACEIASSAAGVPGTGSALDGNYTPHVFTKTYQYSEANRPTDTSSGADLPDLLVAGKSQMVLGYRPMGQIDSVSTSYSRLLLGQTVDATGGVLTQVFGDAALTQAQMSYDANGTLNAYTLQRAAGTRANNAWVDYASGGSPSPDTLQTVLTATGIPLIDAVGNPLKVVDNSPPGQWPAGAEPAATRRLSYWDDYRLAEVQTQYSGGNAPNDTFVSPYEAESEQQSSLYPPLASVANRVTDQQFQYDPRGNLGFASDDANDFPDRSLGEVMNGLSQVNGHTDQFAQAIPASGPNAGALLISSYDAAGNLTSLSARGLPGGSSYTYGWDELGRLATATRSDGSEIAVTEQFAYDAGGQRVRTTRTLTGAQGSSSTTDHTIQVFDSLVLQHASFGGDAGANYERDDKTEHLYFGVGGQLLGHTFYDEENLPTAGGHLHTFMSMVDPLGSTAFVIDHDTGELVERTSYQPYGGAESDYRPERWRSFREDVRYTGHWDNAEVGLVYFGARYYSTVIQRWISPDPLTIHGLGGDINPYAYVRGSPMGHVDPIGLDGEPQSDEDPSTIDAIAVMLQAENGEESGETASAASAWANLVGGESANGWDSGNAIAIAAAEANATPQGGGYVYIDATWAFARSNPYATSAAEAEILGSPTDVPPDPRWADFAGALRGASNFALNLTPIPALAHAADPNASAAARVANAMLAAIAIIPIGDLAGVAAEGLLGAAEGASTLFTAADVGPLPAAIANTFRGGSYTATTLSEATTLYRAYGGTAGQLGSYWTRVAPAGPLQATIDMALNPAWGNTASQIAKISVPAGTTIFEGAAAAQGALVGGGSQVFIPAVEASWLFP